MLADIKGQKIIWGSIYPPNVDDQTFKCFKPQYCPGGDFTVSVDPVLDHSATVICRLENKCSLEKTFEGGKHTGHSEIISYTNPLFTPTQMTQVYEQCCSY